jgi:hypothetical protein
MKRALTLTTLVALSLAGACRDRKADSPPAGTPLDIPPVFVTEVPTGTVTPIPEARKALGPGEEVLLAGMVMGVKRPFVDDRALFVLGDRGTLTPCNARGDDHCPAPWDTCCDPPEARAAGTAAIQVLGKDGEVLPLGLKGVGGLKELSKVTVAGKVAESSTAEAFIVNATAIFVAQE